MHTVEIPVGAFKAVALAAGQQDIRYYLNGMLLEQAKDGLYLVATDGHRMHAMRVRQDTSLPVGAQVIIPNETIAKIKPSRHMATVVVEVADDLRSGCLAYFGDAFSFTAEDGRYPDWRRVLPREATIDGIGASLNTDYLADVAKAAVLMGGKKGAAAAPQLAFAGQRGAVRALIQGQPEFVATIMPQIHKADGKPVVLPAPDWLV
ncbi:MULTISPECIES: hypothetical protein [Achromobacter]|uniref:DNA polymerase III subunit beta family protein n=1 Tax=Achromobacter TaxID=222 RepID=UPI0012E1686F|nr:MULTISPECIES: hypothetical protein [Achromobacter]